MRFIRFLIRRRHFPTLFLPLQRGPLHGFYHFFMGYFVPVYWQSVSKPNRKIAVMDSTPFNHWFDLLPGGTPEIIDQAKTVKIAYLGARSGYAKGYRVVPLVGWDKWLWFHSRNLKRIAEHMRIHFTELTADIHTTTPEVIVLGRDHTPEHYAEKLPTRYGVAKRNIPNLKELVDELSQSFDVELVDGALFSPQEMFVKCSRAKILVGQHGAALTNLFFMTPGSHVMEIAWPELASDDYLEMYRLMAKETGIHWTRPILQEDRFAKINVNTTASLVKEALAQSSA